MIVDCAVYEQGRWLERSRDLSGTHVDAAEAGAFAWVGLVESTPEEFALPPRRMAVSEPLRKVRRRTGDSDRKGTP